MENYKRIFIIDTEYRHTPGSKVEPVSLVAKELLSGEILQFAPSSLQVGSCPLITDQETLIVTFYAPAEASFWSSMKWPTPVHVVDLFVEQKRLDNSNTKDNQTKNSLLAVLLRRGLSAMEASEKDYMRDLILKNKTYSPRETAEILRYNLEDVEATARLFNDMHLLGQIDYDRAVIRGKFSWLAGNIESNGIPIDVEFFSDLKENWDRIELRLIEEVDKDFGVFEGRTFKRDRFLYYLGTKGIPWKYNELGTPLLDDDTFKAMAEKYPELKRLRELRKTLGQLRLHTFPVGPDQRTRAPVSPFSSMTGRNQPRTSQFIFGSAKWIRSLIKPEPGKAVAIIDQSQQEFGVAAALSDDKNMKQAYLSGDPYLAFAKQANAVPQDATKASHPAERELYKACTLAVQYGMGVDSLAERIGQAEIFAQILLEQHRATFKTFWDWQERVLAHASIRGFLFTTFGWEVAIDPIFNPRSIGNFLMQANGAEILRIATILAFEAGIQVDALIHDAVMIESDVDEIEQKTKEMQDLFTAASKIVLNGFALRSDARVVKYPERFIEDKNGSIWDLMNRLLAEVKNEP